MSNICDFCGAVNDDKATRCIYCYNPLTPINNTPASQPIQQTQSPQNRPSTPATIIGENDGGSDTPIIGGTSSFGSDTPIIDGGSDTPIIGIDSSHGVEDDIFATNGWMDILGEMSDNGNEFGIILTDTSKLKDKSEFLGAVNDYIEERKEDSIEYLLLDVASQKICKCNTKDVESVLSLLIEVYEVAVPDYLMIVGDSTVIPTMEWANESRDDDETVPSDLPYITFDVDSPWSGKEFDFNNVTQVGRVPAIPENGFKEAIAYFNAVKKRKNYDKATAWAYSAYEWVKTSINEFTPVSATLYTSPSYTTDSRIAGTKGMVMLGKIDPKYNLLCFNLHGTDSNHRWYGQLGEFYPEAFAGKFLPDTSSYFLCCEACYGAKPNVSKSGEQSIVVHALSHNCLAFLGSSRIAYGYGDGQLGCADIVVGTFAERVSKGDSCGLAFLKGLAKQASHRMRESEIKTIAEFALYGDPSIKLIGSGGKNKRRSNKPTVNKPKQNSAFAFSLFACNSQASAFDSKMGRLTLYSCSAQDMQKYKTMSFAINKTGNAFMTKNFSTASQNEPRIYKLAGRKGYRAVYSAKTGNINNTVILHLDDDGKIENVYVSK